MNVAELVVAVAAASLSDRSLTSYYGYVTALSPSVGHLHIAFLHNEHGREVEWDPRSSHYRS